jgi:hypothetical protein
VTPLTEKIAIAVAAAAIALAAAGDTRAASARRPAPAGAPGNAPAEYTKFTAQELRRGFLALAFGSDLRLGSKLKRIHRFDKPIAVHVIAGGSIDRRDAYERILSEFARAFPDLRLSLTGDSYAADLVVRLIDEKDFAHAIRAAFGAQTARDFVARTDAQCMTAVKSEAEGGIIRADSFIIVDQGDRVFFNCAYHEMLHALGLPNHDQSNPFTTLNQNRMVGYLSVYDRALVRMLYDPRIRSGMTRHEARRAAEAIATDIAAGL